MRTLVVLMLPLLLAGCPEKEDLAALISEFHVDWSQDQGYVAGDLAASSLDFGVVAAGDSATITVRLANIGTASLDVEDVYLVDVLFDDDGALLNELRVENDEEVSLSPLMPDWANTPVAAGQAMPFDLLFEPVYGAPLRDRLHLAIRYYSGRIQTLYVPIVGEGEGLGIPEACEPGNWEPEELMPQDTCLPPPGGSFTPIVEWSFGAGSNCLSAPSVGDLDGDGSTEIVINHAPMLGTGTLSVISGDGGAVVWQATDANLGEGSSTAIGDIDGDGSPDIVAVREYSSGLFGAGDYTVLAYEGSGVLKWESLHFTSADVSTAQEPVLADMDHDGTVEVVVGRVILDGANGVVRAKGEYGMGSYGLRPMGSTNVSEGTATAVLDVDGDGVDEIVTGNAIYDIDGNALYSSDTLDDAMIGIANLDADPDAEIIAVSFNTIRAQNMNLSLLWGPIEIPTANIVSTPAIVDLDRDGYVEIVVAGGGWLICFNHDGTELWRTWVQDESGAAGPSVFDFEGDGWLDIVYADEVSVRAFEGTDGEVKFSSTEHNSATMMEYPIIADVDGDDQAEILVCHSGYDSALSVYGDLDETWGPARPVWNQHAYQADSITDELLVNSDPTPNYQTTNSWHSAAEWVPPAVTDTDLSGEILEVCIECDFDLAVVSARVLNYGLVEVGAGVSVALYRLTATGYELVEARLTSQPVPVGWAGETMTFSLPAEDVATTYGFKLSIDDDGLGNGTVHECSETNNEITWDGEVCP